MKISGQFQAENRWSISSGKPPKRHPIFGGQFAAESGGQFERILHTMMDGTKYDESWAKRIAKAVDPNYSKEPQ